MFNQFIRRLNTAAARQVPVSFRSADLKHTANGTLSLPTSTTTTTAAPVVILVGGTGPIDRDGNAIQIQTQVHSNLAEYLASIGVASLRFDKRGVSLGGKVDNNVFYSTKVDALVADTVGAVRFASDADGAAKLGIDHSKVVVCGHSEGALLMGRVFAALNNPGFAQDNWKSPVSLFDSSTPPKLSNIKGAILLSGFGHDIPSATQFQRDNAIKEIDLSRGFKGWLLRTFFKPAIMKRNHAFWVDLVNEAKWKDKDVVETMFGRGTPFPVGWWRDHYTMDLLGDFKAVDSKVLVVGGRKDLQCDSELVTKKNTDRILPNAESVDCWVGDKLTHMLRDSDEEPSMLQLQQQYDKQVKEPLSPEFLKVVGEWVKKTVQ